MMIHIILGMVMPKQKISLPKQTSFKILFRIHSAGKIMN